MPRTTSFVMTALITFAVTTPILASPIFTIDQQNLIHNTYLRSTTLNQTFTPTLTGIDAVDALLSVSSGSASVSLSLYSGAGIDGTLLGSTSAQTVTNLSAQTYHFDFASTLSLTPGDTYTLSLDDSALNTFRWHASNLNPYAGGSLVDNAGNSVIEFDVVFTEGLHESTIPEPSSFMLLGMGGLTLFGYGWRRRRKAQLSV